MGIFTKPKSQSMEVNINTGVIDSPRAGSLRDAYNGNISGYSIEEHLFSFAAEYPYSFLCSSWIIEKEAFQKRLATIPLTFPSFSSHGADHSAVILSRIEALLGENRIRLLSPTDAWLLLQCAYSHDIGMCVADKEKNALFSEIERNPNALEGLLSNEDFMDYLTVTDSSPLYSPFHMHDRFISSVRFLHQMIDRNDQDEMKKFIKQVKSAEYSQAKNILSTVAMRYFRSRHAQRSRDMLIREAQDSTLNGVLPVRLRKIVAEIDYCHGTAWQEILVRLPPQDNGLHTDYIHPQFIAALLRLGDLLDLDSNRFNPFQLELIGRLDKDSVIHKIKNMAINKFMVDTQWIDIEARYRYEEVYSFLTTHYFAEEHAGVPFLTEDERRLETRKIIEKSANALRDWISCLHDDLKEFSHNWNAIVPSNMTGYIAALRKNDIFIGDGDVPVESDELELRYVISPRRASQIIEGSELYNDSLVFIRELTQNSIDATKRQIYKSIVAQRDDSGSGGLFKSSQIKADSLFLPSLRKCKVSVLIEYVRASSDGVEKPDELKITFRDYGIGITYEKLKQMRHIGAISMSKEERDELNETPQWLRPTGEYGIGMQSVFTIADSFDITTYPRYERMWMTDRQRNIRLFCPELGGDIVNEEEPKSEKDKKRFGTDVIVRLPLVHKNIVKLLQHRDFGQFDSRSDKILDINAIFERLRRYILETFTDDIVSLDFTFISPEGEPDDRKKTERTLASFSFPNCLHHFYSLGDSFLFLREQSEQGQQPAICFWHNSDDGKESVLLTLRNAEESRVRLYYKGIIINNNDNSFPIFKIPGVDAQVNIMSGTAGELLEISRDYIKPTGYRLIRNLVQNALNNFYRAVFLCLSGNEKEEKEAVRKELKEKLYQFFIQNLEHMMCFYQILCTLKEQIDLSGFDNIAKELESRTENALYIRNLRAYQSDSFAPYAAMFFIMSILHGKMYISKIASHEAIRWIQAGSIWYTDFRFEDSFSSSIELREENGDVICAMYDNLSGIYDLTYDKVRIIQDKTWKAQYIKLYTLVKVEEGPQYPHFMLEEYHRLCLLIVNEYIDLYLSEKDPYRKEELGNYILSFPAIKTYQDIAVDHFPAESPNELAARFTRFIVCPCNVKELSHYFINSEQSQAAENSSSKLTFLTQEELDALFSDNKVKTFIEDLPLIRQDISPRDKVDRYINLFRNFGLYKSFLEIKSD